MKAAILIAALLFWSPMALTGEPEQKRSIPIGQSPYAVAPADPKLWLTVDCALVEGASPAGCLFILPPPKVIFYDYPADSEVCTAETAGDIGIRCVRFDVLKAWIENRERIP